MRRFGRKNDMIDISMSLFNPETWPVLDVLFDGIYILNRERKIIFWNDGAEQITGYKRSQMIGRFCHESPLKHLDEERKNLCMGSCPASKAMEQNQPALDLVWVYCADQTLKPLETHIKPLHNGHGEVIGAIEIFRDVTKWKELEAMTEEKDRLMGILAHDLRSPLSVIQSYAKLIRHDLKGMDLADVRETILSRVHFGLELIKNVLDAKALEHATLASQLESIPLHGFLQSVRKNYQPIAEAKHIHLALDVPPDPMFVDFDPMRLQECLHNLISNAIHYSHPHTTVRIQLVKRDSKTLEIRVKDQGVGIRPEEMKLLFNAFGRTTNRTTAGEASSGLGLYIVKKIMRAFQGDVTVESVFGSGSTFTLVFISNGKKY
jgi:PAS domain S-box-containing protein